MRVVFFGTPPIAAYVLQYLVEHHINVVAVISRPDRPQGRSQQPVPVPVKVVAQKQQPSIPVFQPEKVSAPEFASTLTSFDADLFVVVAYGEILKQHVLDTPKFACINLHASLLPKYRGAAPIQRVIMQGETETGVTIMHMVKQMDAGDMIKSVKIPIGPDMTAGELEQQIAEKGSNALLEVIEAYKTSTPAAVPQDHTQATFAPKVELIDCEIRWDNFAQQLHNLVRGTNPEPGAWTQVVLKGTPKRLRIFKTKVHPQVQGKPAEILTYGKQGLLIGCQTGALELLDIQLEGKKRMTAQELMVGYPKDAWQF